MLNEKLKFESSYLELPEVFYTIQSPDKVKETKLIKLNYSLMEELGIDKDLFVSEDSQQLLSGNKILDGSTPLAQAYGGHQFGHFTMLGDGRAILLGEYITKDGERVDIQLKGAGKTPYSRGGDGRAALGPMVREYIISEAMHGLRIPTTRSLAVVATGENITREKVLKGAVLTRIDSSHIRVGTFEFAARMTEINHLKALADYTIKRHYKEAINENNRYLYLLDSVIKKQAKLIAKWQLVGFIHGVMNTDNMTISGETIDYGPCAFMDNYDPNTVFSSIDYYGRYGYSNQPKIAIWNLSRFAESLLPLLAENREEAISLAENSLGKFSSIFNDEYLNGFRRKLGLFAEDENDTVLIDKLLDIMKEGHCDFTNTFRDLTLGNDEKLIGIDEKFKEWLESWRNRLTIENKSSEEVLNLMKNNNPAVIPRNESVEEALRYAEKGDFTYLESLLSILANPYEYNEEQNRFAASTRCSSYNYKTYCGT